MRLKMNSQFPGKTSSGNLTHLWVCLTVVGLALGTPGCSSEKWGVAKWFKAPGKVSEDPFAEDDKGVIASKDLKSKELIVSDDGKTGEVKTADKKSKKTKDKTVAKDSDSEDPNPFSSKTKKDKDPLRDDEQAQAVAKAEREKKEAERRARAVAEAKAKAKAKARETELAEASAESAKAESSRAKKTAMADNSWDNLRTGKAPTPGSRSRTSDDDLDFPTTKRPVGDLPEGRVASSDRKTDSKRPLEKSSDRRESESYPDETPRSRDRVVHASREETQRKVKSLVYKARSYKEEGRLDEALDTAEYAADLSAREGIVSRKSEEDPDSLISEINNEIRKTSGKPNSSIIRQPVFRGDSNGTANSSPRLRNTRTGLSTSSDRDFATDSRGSSDFDRSERPRTPEGWNSADPDNRDSSRTNSGNSTDSYPDIRDIRDRRRTSMENSSPSSKATNSNSLAQVTKQGTFGDMAEPLVQESVSTGPELRQTSGPVSLASIEVPRSDKPASPKAERAADDTVAIAPPPPTYVGGYASKTSPPRNVEPANSDYRWFGLVAAIGGIALFRRRNAA